MYIIDHQEAKMNISILVEIFENLLVDLYSETKINLAI